MMKLSAVQRNVLQHLKDGDSLLVTRDIVTVRRQRYSKYGAPMDSRASIATVRALDNKGLIEEHTSPGTWTSYFSLTEAGRAAMEDER